eukprot:885357_1
MTKLWIRVFISITERTVEPKRSGRTMSLQSAKLSKLKIRADLIGGNDEILDPRVHHLHHRTRGGTKTFRKDDVASIGKTIQTENTPGARYQHKGRAEIKKFTKDNADLIGGNDEILDSRVHDLQHRTHGGTKTFRKDDVASIGKTIETENTH